MNKNYGHTILLNNYHLSVALAVISAGNSAFAQQNIHCNQNKNKGHQLNRLSGFLKKKRVFSIR